jgi:DNA polymerase V
VYAHIDSNNFFVSCERLFRPDLENKPVAVLSNNDGCFISRSNEVKQLGIQMASPVFEVKSLIRQHDITLFSANFELYGDISERVVTFLRKITPLLEVYSIDESFLDLSELKIADFPTWAENVRKQIQKDIGIPVSIGVGPTKTLAKVATTHAKKHGFVTIVHNEASRQEVLEQLAVEDVWGIGYRTAPKLRERGVRTAWQLVSADDAWLRQYFNIGGMRMIQELRGVSCLTFGDAHDKRQSIMVSRAFGHTVRSFHQIESATASFTARAAAKLRSQGSVCGKISVSLAVNGGGIISESYKLLEATADTGRIITEALLVVEQLYDPELSYKKVMITLLDIVDKQAWQLSLTDPVKARDRQSNLMSGVDALNARYGAGTVWHAAEDRAGATWQSKHALRSPRYTTKWDELPTIQA